MTNAFIYIRFSTPKQEQGDSKDRQLTACTLHCQHKGWTIAGVLEDLGRSAYKGDHLNSGQLGQFTARVKSGEIPPGTILLVERLDRLSRQGHSIALRWMHEMFDHGIRIATLDGDRIYDSNSLNSSLLDTIEILMKANLAHQESEAKGMRVASAWRKKQERTKEGVPLTKGCPRWLEVVGQGKGDQGTAYRVIPERAAVVRQIFQWCADGHGVQKIAKLLGQSGTPAWGRTGNGWNTSHVIRIIEGPTAEGDYIPYYHVDKKPDGDRVVGFYPRVVDADLVARARAAYKSRQGTGGRNRWEHANLFSGLMYCSDCGGKVHMRRSPMNERGGRLGPGYVGCITSHLGRGCSNGALVRYRPFEETALREMLHLALDDKFFQMPGNTLRAANELAEVDKAIADHKSRAANLAQLYAAVPTPEVMDQVAATSAKIRTLEAERVILERNLTIARGSVSPAEHLQRVSEVQNALGSEDIEIRHAARQKVHEAIKGVVHQVIVDTADTYGDGLPKKVYTLILVGGVQAWKIDYKGKLLGKVDMAAALEAGDTSYTLKDGSVVTTNTEALRAGIVGDDKGKAAQLDALLRRRKEA